MYSSYPLDGAQFYSWEIEDIGAEVHVITTTKCRNTAEPMPRPEMLGKVRSGYRMELKYIVFTHTTFRTLLFSDPTLKCPMVMRSYMAQLARLLVHWPSSVGLSVGAVDGVTLYK